MHAHGMTAPRWWLIALIGMLLAGCGRDERAKIRTTYNEYVQAVLAGDGQKAFMRVDQETIDYYTELKRKALDDGPFEIARYPFVDRLMIGIIRSSMQPSYIRQLSGEQMFMYAVQEGWVLDDAAPTSEISKIEVEGDTATASSSVRGHDTIMDYHFVRESGSWKLSVSRTFSIINSFSKAIAAREGKSEDQVILDALTEMTGKPVTAKIWEKPKS